MYFRQCFQLAVMLLLNGLVFTTEKYNAVLIFRTHVLWEKGNHIPEASTAELLV